MQEFITNGVVQLEPYDSYQLGEGVRGIVDIDDVKTIVTVNYLNSTADLWVCTDKYGDMYISDIVFRPVIVTEDYTVDIQLKDWQYILSKSIDGTTQRCTVTPYKFKKGMYSVECSLCYGYFTAANSQKICEKCCLEKAVAKLHKVLSSSPKVTKTKGSYTHIQMREIALWAFSLGVASKADGLIDGDTFNENIDNYLKTNHGYNNN